MKLNELDEAELKVQTQQMFNAGGVDNVMQCVLTMWQCSNIILKKLNEILDEEEYKRNG